MLNDHGKDLLRRWCSVQNIVAASSVVCLIVLAIRHFDPDSSELASWVQAVGSVVAIVVAAFLPIWHASVTTERKQQALLGILRVLADEVLEEMWLLTNTLAMPDKENRQMLEYRHFRRGRIWEGLVNDLAQMPLADLPPQHAKSLGVIRDAAKFGSFVADQIPAWIARGGYSEPHVTETLRGKRDLLTLIRATLPVAEGIYSPVFVDAQRRGQPYELRRPYAAPIQIGETKIYRRYVWENDQASIPDCVYLHFVFPYGDDDFTPGVIERKKSWTSFSVVETEIDAEIEHMLNAYLEHMSSLERH